MQILGKPIQGAAVIFFVSLYDIWASQNINSPQNHFKADDSFENYIYITEETACTSDLYEIVTHCVMFW